MAQHELDVVIIGAGMAGLIAALELKNHALRYAVLEAQSFPGGRAASGRTQSGVPIDLGAHWLHGKSTPLKETLEYYGVPYSSGDHGMLRIYENGQVEKANGSNWLEEAIDQTRAEAIKKGELPDCLISELGKTAADKRTLAIFASMWDGLDPPFEPSALEFLNDKNTPGGLQLPRGLGELFGHMVRHAGQENVRFNVPINHIRSIEDSVTVQSISGEIWRARAALFTGSLAVIKSGMVDFDPSLSESFRESLSKIAMGKMNKMIAELKPEFFDERGIAKDLALELLDAKPPQFCHVRSAGNPLINLFISGPMAQRVETFSEAEVLAHLKKTLAPVKELEGFESYLVATPVVTQWVGNPYTQGAYSACLPGGKRPTSLREGRVYFAGDTFDAEYPASLAGAFRSGKSVARQIAQEL